MDKSKTKNLIIVLLLLVNAFLLVLVAGNLRTASKVESFRIETLEKILDKNGMSLAKSIDFSQTLPKSLSLTRNLNSEQKMVSSLLGKCRAVEKGGAVMSYVGENGSATFRGTGDFDILFSSNGSSNYNDPVSAAKSVLKKMGVKYSKSEPLVTQENGRPCVTLVCAYESSIVYNARAKFNFISESEILITGRLPFTSPVSSASTGECSDAITVLMQFWDNTRKAGEVSSEIWDLQIGYFLDSTVIDYCGIQPVWKIITDTSEYYVDGITGKATHLKDFS